MEHIGKTNWSTRPTGRHRKRDMVCLNRSILKKNLLKYPIFCYCKTKAIKIGFGTELQV